MDNYYDTQFAKMTVWIKLFQRMNSTQKIRIFTDSKENAVYENTVSKISFEDLTVFVDFGEPDDISANDGVIVIGCYNECEE